MSLENDPDAGTLPLMTKVEGGKPTLLAAA
jgi:hypothetical protein